MKLCKRCNTEKDESEFYDRDRVKGSTHVYCKICFNKYVKARWTERKIKQIELKGNKCFDCGGAFHYSVYDFHHLDPTIKEYTWDKLRLRSFESIQKELSQCILLCSNCHRLRHYAYSG